MIHLNASMTTTKKHTQYSVCNIIFLFIVQWMIILSLIYLNEVNPMGILKVNGGYVYQYMQVILTLLSSFGITTEKLRTTAVHGEGDRIKRDRSIWKGINLSKIGIMYFTVSLMLACQGCQE